MSGLTPNSENKHQKKTLAACYRFLKAELLRVGYESPEQAAREIIAYRSMLGWSDILIKPETELSDDVFNQIMNDLDKCREMIPLSRIYGVRNFYGLDFMISGSTLDPRQDTETLINIALDLESPPKTILDIGTGSGCILLTLLNHWSMASGVGADISVNALAIAKENATKIGINTQKNTRAYFIQTSWTDGIDEKFDLVVSNPPYICSDVIPTLDESVRRFDPILALDGGKDGLQAYRKIFLELKKILKPSGKALFEIGFDQGESVARLAEESGFSVKHVHPDIAGQPRVVEIFLGVSSGDK